MRSRSPVRSEKRLSSWLVHAELATLQGAAVALYSLDCAQ
jgi:hypothetical protein